MSVRNSFVYTLNQKWDLRKFFSHKKISKFYIVYKKILDNGAKVDLSHTMTVIPSNWNNNKNYKKKQKRMCLHSWVAALFLKF